MIEACFYTIVKQGARLTVKAKPGVAKLRAPQVVDIGNGQTALEVSVREAAEDGKANRALCERVADLCGVPKAAVAVKAGASGRIKIMEITGDAVALEAAFKALVAQGSF